MIFLDSVFGIGLKVLERQVVGRSLGESFLEVPSTNRHVTIIPSDLDLFTLAHGDAVRINPQHHGCFSPAMADRFDLGQGVCPCEKMLAALKQVALEVGS